MQVLDNCKIIIHGVTTDGQSFRPSDWAERLGGQLSSVVNRRIKYSPLLRPCVHDGNKCVLLSPCLKKDNPGMYISVLKFAKLNKLKITISDIT